MATVPLGRGSTAGDVANACCYLASEEANFITGVNLEVSHILVCDPIYDLIDMDPAGGWRPMRIMSRLSRDKSGLETVLDGPMGIVMGDFRNMRRPLSQSLHFCLKHSLKIDHS